jgi:Predicted integral membrane protein
MRSLALSVLIGLVGAALLHIVIVLALPRWTGSDAFTRVTALGETGRFFALANEANPTGLFNDDPHIRSAVCRFDLSDGPVRVLANGDVPIWTTATYDAASNETYSLNDRSAIGDGVDLTLVTPTQLLLLKRNMPAALTRSVMVELKQEQGYVVIRAIVPDKSAETSARAFLSEATCNTMVLG